MPLYEIGRSLREGGVSAASLVERSFQQIARLDGSLNAVIRTRSEAYADAAEIDARLEAGEDLAPLVGMPLLVKDNEDVAGLPTTFGSRLREHAPAAQRDCEVVSRLRGAGAIVVGKTNLPEFGCEGYTSNLVFGDTRNPWAQEWSPGGSSGGAGAAISAGLAPLATGTDGGGSIRIPAAFCGLVGLKPTGGLIGRDPTPSWIDLSSKGPLAVSVADAALLLDVMAGPVAGDPTAAPTWSPRPGVFPDRILATPRMVDYGRLPRSIESLFEDAIAGLSAASGIEVDRVPAPFTEQVDDDWLTTMAVEELTWIGRDLVAERAADLSPPVRATLDRAARISVDDYLAARRRRFEATRLLDELLGDAVVLVSPTMCVEGFTPDGRLGRDEPVGTPTSAYNTQAANITGHPALSVPAGISPNGVPFGMQIIGPRFADDMVLAVGAAWEAARPWPIVAPGFTAFGV